MAEEVMERRRTGKSIKEASRLLVLECIAAARLRVE